MGFSLFGNLTRYIMPYMSFLSVRPEVCHPTSFRFYLTIDTIVIGYVFPTIRAHYGLSPIRLRPCWANQKKGSTHIKNCVNPFFSFGYYLLMSDIIPLKNFFRYSIIIYIPLLPIIPEINTVYLHSYN